MENRARVIGRLREAATLLGISGDWTRSEAFLSVSDVIFESAPNEGLAAWIRAIRLEARSVSEELAWAEALDACLGRQSGTVMRLRQGLPPDVVRLLRIRGLSPQKVSVAWREHGVDGLESLKRALADDVLVRSGVLDRSTATDLPRVIRDYEKGCAGWLRPEARSIANSLVSHIRLSPRAHRVAWAEEAAGPAEVTGEIHVLVGTSHFEAIGRWMSQWPGLASPLIERQTGWMFRAEGGLPCRIWACNSTQFEVEFYRLCSAPEHWARLLEWADSKGLKIEDGRIWREGDHGLLPVPIGGQDELFRVLELEFIEPELRRGRDEIELADKRVLPRLVSVPDLRGDLHSHSTFSDGSCHPEGLLDAAKARGYEYFGISDHTQSTWMGGGMRIREVAEYLAHLRDLAARRKDIRLLLGLEVDILRDGSLDMPDEILSQLDVVIASVHSEFHLPTMEQTRRIRKAMQHPLVHILAHPSGRLLGRRSPLPVPLAVLVEMASHTATWLEVNGNPERLDMSSGGLEMCRAHGVKVVVSSDAHHKESLAQVEWGVQVSRWGGLEAHDIVNTLPVSDLLKALQSKRRRMGVV